MPATYRHAIPIVYFSYCILDTMELLFSIFYLQRCFTKLFFFFFFLYFFFFFFFFEIPFLSIKLFPFPMHFKQSSIYYFLFFTSQTNSSSIEFLLLLNRYLYETFRIILEIFRYQIFQNSLSCTIPQLTPQKEKKRRQQDSKTSKHPSPVNRYNLTEIYNRRSSYAPTRSPCVLAVLQLDAPTLDIRSLHASSVKRFDFHATTRPSGSRPSRSAARQQSINLVINAK